MSGYILAAIYSVIYAYRRLERPGVSKEVRQMFLKKHFVYVIVFIILWTLQLSQNYYQLFNPVRPTVQSNSLLEAIFRPKANSIDWLSARLGFRGQL